VETAIERGGDCCLGASLHAEHVCQQCGHELCSAVGLVLLDQSEVVAFCEAQGIAVSETPYWRFGWCVDDDPVTVVSEDPWRLRVAVTAGGAALAATVDGDLSVLETAPL
jgi:hypothetical protein